MMNSTTAPDSSKLSPITSAFVLAAAVAVLFNTALAWAKDGYAPLNNFMKSLTGHPWTTHGLADLLLVGALGFIFVKTGVAERMDPHRLIAILVASVVIAGLGLLLWYTFV